MKEIGFVGGLDIRWVRGSFTYDVNNNFGFLDMKICFEN